MKYILSALILFGAALAGKGIGKAFVLPIEGIALHDSASASSQVIALLPYNAELEIIQNTKVSYQDGWITGTWAKVKYGGLSGYCPGICLFKNKLPDTAALQKLRLDSFLKLAADGFFYIHRERTGEYYASDSVYIKHMDAAACYFLMRLCLRDLQFPGHLENKEYNLKDCTLKVNYGTDRRREKYLMMNWMFDGGNTEMKITENPDGSTILIEYFPD